MLRYLTLIFYGVFGIGCIYAFFLIFCFSTFKIPSDSMEPQLQTGDQVLVNKWIAGPRLFNIFASMKGKRVDIYRVPGVGQIKRNDILVFNYPHPYSWERIEMHIMQYYIKRCLGLPGDSIRIEQGFYRNNHTKEPLGNVESQANLSRQKADRMPDGVYRCFPFDSTFNWNVHDFGPLYIPRKGDRITVNQTNYKLYKQMIEWESKDSLSWKDSKVYIGDKQVRQYRFQSNYYFVAGDKTENSRDSRYLGLIPECSIVSMAAAASVSAGLPRILPSQATTVSAPSTRVSVIVVSPLFCSGSQTPLTASFSHTASAFCADSSSTTFAGSALVIRSSPLLRGRLRRSLSLNSR